MRFLCTLRKTFVKKNGGRNALATLILAGFALSSCGGSGESTNGGAGSRRFEVLFENIATNVPLVTSTGERLSIAFSPFVIAVHSSPAPFFTLSASAPANGLEAFAEDGAPQQFLSALQTVPGVSLIAFAATPVGQIGTSILTPGTSYRSVIQAEPGDFLSFITSYLQANDLVVSTPVSGVPLFDASGVPANANLTLGLQLIDIGTEQNEEPGAGPNQVVRQLSPNSGQTTNAPVGPVSDGFQYPSLGGTLRVTARPLEG